MHDRQFPSFAMRAIPITAARRPSLANYYFGLSCPVAVPTVFCKVSPVPLAATLTTSPAVPSRPPTAVPAVLAVVLKPEATPPSRPPPWAGSSFPWSGTVELALLDDMFAYTILGLSTTGNAYLDDGRGDVETNLKISDER